MNRQEHRTYLSKGSLVLGLVLFLLLPALVSAVPKANGQTCTSPNTETTECASNFCSPDGFCCDTACRGVCRSCSTGNCSFVASGTSADLACSDGDLCNGVETCDGAGGCTSSMNTTDMCQPSSVDQSQCRTAYCDSHNQTCSVVNDPRLGLPCGTSSIGKCKLGTYQCVTGSVTCVGAVNPVSEVADNTFDDDCNGLVDESTPQDCVSVSDCQTASTTCVQVACTSGFCQYNFNAVGTSCSTHNSCWQSATCDSNGACVTNGSVDACEQAGYEYPIETVGQCTTGFCNSTGCYSVPFAGPCADGNKCTINDACGSNGTCSGTPLSCDDSNSCTDDACDPTQIPADGNVSNNVTYCTHTPKANGTACARSSDSNGGSWSGTCQLGTCIETYTPKGCDGVVGSGTVLDACGVCNGTNSTCMGCDGVPNSGKVVDACGVCGGTNSTCAGCDGVPNSGLVNDSCGVCGGNNSTCSGCDGVPNSGLVFDVCGVCNGTNTTCNGCDGVPNSGKTIDACGVCGGTNSTCADCAGVPNGVSVIDACGVCGGNNSTCAGCDGVPNSNKTTDACGVCGGTNSTCAGCDGVPNSGLVNDSCSVCGGNNSTCAGCDGVPNSGVTLDACGVCNGTNTTCAGCDGVPNSGIMIDSCGNCGGNGTDWFGYRAVGSHAKTCDGFLIHATKFRTDPLGGYVTSMHVYFGADGASGPGSQDYIVGVYDNNVNTSRPLNRLGSSTLSGVVASSWNSISLNRTYLKPSTTYWLAVLHSADSCNDNNLYYSNSTTGSVTVSASVSLGQTDLPSAFPATGVNVHTPMLLSIYAMMDCPVPGCDGILNSLLVNDACGVCGGNNSSCAGCDGVPNSGLVVDACGICGGNNSTCAGCDAVPNSGLVVDACGVCGGNNSTCAGCDGVPNSNKTNDVCGICNGNNSTCAGCDGVPNSGKVLDACGSCGGNGSGCAGCDGVPNSGLITDACGVCGGNGLSCAGCDGISNSGKINDACGVCGGNGSSCAGCDGVPNSGLVNDACGVCNGDGSACAGCDGVSNSGKVVDACSICGGNNSTCADCLGIPNGNASLDACGWCNGDNSSCAGCDGVPNSGKLNDPCGICNGNGSSCSGCDGVPNSGKLMDDCGLCGGDGSSCAGCDGVPNSGKVPDNCSVCGGNGSSCYVYPSSVSSTYTQAESGLVLPPGNRTETGNGTLIQFAEGLSLVINPNNTVVFTTIHVTTNPTGVNAPTGYSNIGQFWDFELSSASNNGSDPVSFTSVITFFYNRTNLNASGIAQEATVVLGYFDTSSNAWVLLTNSSSVNTSVGSVSVFTTHFSVWSVFGQIATQTTTTPATTSPPTTTTSAPSIVIVQDAEVDTPVLIAFLIILPFCAVGIIIFSIALVHARRHRGRVYRKLI